MKQLTQVSAPKTSAHTLADLKQKAIDTLAMASQGNTS